MLEVSNIRVASKDKIKIEVSGRAFTISENFDSQAKLILMKDAGIFFCP
jgi:hypothetical protein